jgi:competence protein ComEC
MPAAIWLVAGIALGAWSLTGTTGAVILVLLSAGLLILAAPRERSPIVARFAFAVFWLGLGFASGLARISLPATEARETFRVLSPGADEAVRLEGVLVDFWSGLPPRARSRLRTERIESEGAWRVFPADVTVFLSGETSPERTADRGDRVRLVGRLTPEDLPASDRDIPLPWPRYRLSVKSALRIERVSPTLLSLLTLPNRGLTRSLPPPGSRGEAFDRDVRGPLAALLLGRTSELDRGMVANYRRGGLYHLLVVSGLHVVLAAGLVLALLHVLRIESKRRDLALVVAVFVFVLIGGANPPSVRAGVVFGVFLLSRLLERPIAAAQAIGLSALVLFLIAPHQIYSIGTVLTFAAVLGIALFTQPIRAILPARPEWLFGALAVAVAAEVATAPVLFWRFNLVAAGAWLTAPLAVPLSGALIALGALLLLFFAAGIFPSPLVALFGLGCRALETIAERAAGVAYLRPTPALAAVLLVSLLTLLAALAPRRARLPAALAAISLFLFLALRPGAAGPARGFSIEALDVGQGDALLLRWGRRALLVDGGGPFDLSARDFGRTRLLPKLLDRGVTRLDAALVTHPHPDHALGVFAVLEELPVGVLWRSAGEDEGALYRGLLAAAAGRGVPAAVLQTGHAVRFGDAKLSVLHSGGRRRKKDAVNNQSLVAFFERDGRRALLTGDIGAPTEEDILWRGRWPRADLLKIAHHGSRTSTTPAFLAAVAPKAALLSCGRQNRFGHPHPQTLETLSRLGVPVFRTDLSSDARVELLPEATLLKLRGIR